MSSTNPHIAALAEAAPRLTAEQIAVLRRALNPPTAEITAMPLRPRTSVRRCA